MKTVLKFFYGLVMIIGIAPYSVAVTEEKPDGYSDREITEHTTKYNNMADFYHAKTRYAASYNAYKEEINKEDVKSSITVPDLPKSGMPSLGTLPSTNEGEVPLGIEREKKAMYLKSVYGLSSDLKGEIVWGDSILPVQIGTHLPYGYKVIGISDNEVLIKKANNPRKIRISTTPTEAPER